MKAGDRDLPEVLRAALADGLKHSPPGACRLWVAYSGGMDSHVLLHALRQLDISPRQLHAVHVDHGLHADSGQWRAHCEDVCRTLGVPLNTLSVDARPAPGQSPEAAAREARYTAIRQFLDSRDVLLTAHHEDDQAETLLLQLLRGAGPKGLAAMPKCAPLGAGRLLRPMLGLQRAQIRRYAEARNLAWIDDPSNFDTDLNRNFLRHEILPKLRERWPSLGETLSRSARHCAEAAELLETRADADLAYVLGTPTNYSELNSDRNRVEKPLIEPVGLNTDLNSVRSVGEDPELDPGADSRTGTTGPGLGTPTNFGGTNFGTPTKSPGANSGPNTVFRAPIESIGPNSDPNSVRQVEAVEPESGTPTHETPVSGTPTNHAKFGTPINLARLNQLSDSRAADVLRSWVARAGLPAPHEAHVSQILSQRGARGDAEPLVHWPGAEVRRYRDGLYLMAPLAEPPSTGARRWDLIQDSHESGLAELDLAAAGVLRAHATLGEGLDAAGLATAEVTVGFRQGGERCRPWRRAHSRSLKKLLQEYGVPPWWRERMPLIFVDGELAAVADLWICEPFAAGEGGPGFRLQWRLPGRANESGSAKNI